ncbi:MAG: hypothetical protein JRI25_12345 [Deltaproteobacteria bacterium]|nr:hypothetical protein [Deltaproteobacteria bacterium]MBW2255373.1 hypothetical protein [Deltaproteobacteria bacterium]
MDQDDDAHPDVEHDMSRGEVEPPPPLSESLAHLLSRLLFRGRRGLGRAAERSRSRLELRQLQKDRDHFWVRLGRTAYHLVEAGEIDHPALRKAIARIDEIEARIDALHSGGKGAADDGTSDLAAPKRPH